jgi:hypothetical protein
MTENTVSSPVYRYFTVDLLSNEILEEIPFRSVSYQRTIKGAGSFSGSIPVIETTDNLNLYENTMPGNTAVFVVRDGVCVWGGIIWSRDYDIVSRVLKIDASEFTSYLYHRRIWKTWSQQYGATLIVGGDLAEVTFDSGYSSALKPGASVRIDFNDSANFKYAGYYKVSASPVPTTNKFYLESTKSIADITSVERDDNLVYIKTENRHGFNTGDKIYVDLGTESIFTGERTITVRGGTDTKQFSFQMTGADEGPTNVTGTASRPVPDGTYKKCTITVRTDTYDYIRSLIDAVSKDFTGGDFPNTYVEPGIRTAVDVVTKEINSGVAIIETSQKHNLSAGQSVELKDVDPLYDGEYEVTTVLTPKSFSYPLSGYEVQTDVSVLNADIVSVSATNSVATVTTSAAHGFIVGNNAEVSVESDLGSFASSFNGTYEITEVPNTTTFKYKISNSGSLPVTTFTLPTAVEGANTHEILRGSVYQDVSPEYTITSRTSLLFAKTITTSITHAVLAGDVITITDLSNEYNGSHVVVSVTSNTISYVNTVSKTETVAGGTGKVVGNRSTASLYTAETNDIAVGDSVTVSNADLLLRIAEKSYDAANTTATITTAGAHYLQNGDSVDITGLRDTSAIISKKIVGTGATKEVTLTTSVAHNIEKNDSVEIKDMYDVYTISKKKIDSNVFTLTTATAHNLAVANNVTVDGVVDTYNITAYRLKTNVARLIIGNHNFRVNDEITVTSLKDSALVVSKELQAGVAILTTDLPHNFVDGMQILVSGVGDPFNGTFTISSVTDTQVFYETAVTTKIRNAEDEYNQALASAVSRGVASPSTDADVVKKRKVLTDLLAGSNADMKPAKVTSATALITSKTSILNGVNRISEVTATTVSYRQSGNDAPQIPVTVVSTTISKKSATAKDCTLTVASVASFNVGDKITVPAGPGTRFSGDFLIASISDTDTAKTITYANEGAVVEEVASSGTLVTKVDVSGASPFNGKFAVASTPSGTTLTYNLGMAVTYTLATTTVCTLKFTYKYPVAVGDSVIIAGVSARYNGTFTIATLTTDADVVTITYENAGTATAANTSPTGTITPSRVNIAETVVPLAVADGVTQANVSVESVHNGTRTVKKVDNRNTFVFDQTIAQTVDFVDTLGTVSVDSIFNGNNKIVTATSDTTFEYSLSGSSNNVIETATTQLAFVSVDGIFNGTFTVTAIDPEDNQLYYGLTPSRRTGVPIQIIPGYGHATVTPMAIISSFGPFPGNADIGIDFSTRKYSGVNLMPTTYRGFELRSVGEVLNSYADSIDGFEYRIDCEYDAVTNSFKKIFVLIPINFPAAPPAGEISPLSRFGADKLVFEYPGNVANVSLKETAENSATRFFAVGETDLGPAAGPPFSVKAADGFLSGKHGSRRWPLLDADIKIKDVEDETTLYPYAVRYLTESRPPEGQFTVTVNGSLTPFVGTYAPGDWCSVIVNDKFILERMRNDIELRDTVLVRKIDAIKVSVPDGTTFPETVELILIPEWEVDKIG